MYTLKIEHPTTCIKLTIDAKGFSADRIAQIETELKTRLNLISDHEITNLRNFLLGEIDRAGNINDRFSGNQLANLTYSYLVSAGDYFKEGDQDSLIDVEVDISLFHQELVNLLIRIENYTRLKALRSVGLTRSVVNSIANHHPDLPVRFDIALTALYSSTSKRCKFLIKDLANTRGFPGGGNEYQMQYFTRIIQSAFDNAQILTAEAESYLKRVSILYGLLEMIEYWKEPTYNDCLENHLFGTGVMMINE